MSSFTPISENILIIPESAIDVQKILKTNFPRKHRRSRSQKRQNRNTKQPQKFVWTEKHFTRNGSLMLLFSNFPSSSSSQKKHKWSHPQMHGGHFYRRIQNCKRNFRVSISFEEKPSLTPHKSHKKFYFIGCPEASSFS